MEFSAKTYSTMKIFTVGALQLEWITMPGAYWAWKPWRRVALLWNNKDVTSCVCRVLAVVAGVVGFLAVYGLVGSWDLEDAQAAEQKVSPAKTVVVQQKQEKVLPPCILSFDVSAKECLKK